MAKIIQLASADHIDQILALENKSFPDDQMAEQTVRRFIRNGNMIVLLMCSRVIGSAVLLKRKDTLASRLYSLAIDPIHRGRGIGSILLSGVESMAIGHSEIRLEVREDNMAAINLYFKHGYKKFGRRMKYYKDGMNALRMVKELPLD
jgi:[ribosomal protein S18]-alanine N-acetyltransferase